MMELRSGSISHQVGIVPGDSTEWRQRRRSSNYNQDLRSSIGSKNLVGAKAPSEYFVLDYLITCLAIICPPLAIAVQRGADVLVSFALLAGGAGAAFMVALIWAANNLDRSFQEYRNTIITLYLLGCIPGVIHAMYTVLADQERKRRAQYQNLTRRPGLEAALHSRTTLIPPAYRITKWRLFCALFCVFTVLVHARLAGLVYRNRGAVPAFLSCSVQTLSLGDCLDTHLRDETFRPDFSFQTSDLPTSGTRGSYHLYPGALSRDLSWVNHPDPYAVLGVSKSASQKEIRHAYNRLAKQWHPDKCTSGLLAEENAGVMKWINDAWEQLDERRRGRQREDMDEQRRRQEEEVQSWSRKLFEDSDFAYDTPGDTDRDGEREDGGGGWWW